MYAPSPSDALTDLRQSFWEGAGISPKDAAGITEESDAYIGGQPAAGETAAKTGLSATEAYWYKYTGGESTTGPSQAQLDAQQPKDLSSQYSGTADVVNGIASGGAAVGKAIWDAATSAADTVFGPVVNTIADAI